jgi:multiple sugar transport system substrate-binding protein
MVRKLVSKKVSKKWIVLMVCFMMLFPLLTACLGGDSADSNEERVLRIGVMYGAEDDYFRSQFTDIFEFMNKNITIELVPLIDQRRYYYGGGQSEEQEQPDPIEEIIKVLEGTNPPDVLLVDYSQLPALIDKNMLLALDSLMTKDKFDVNELVPAVSEGLKILGDNKFYALSPTFNSNAMIFNKKIFDAAAVPYPTDGMTWEQVFDLAKTSIVQNAWKNGQELHLNGWVYGLNSGLVNDLGVNFSCDKDLDAVYQLKF